MLRRFLSSSLHNKCYLYKTYTHVETQSGVLCKSSMSRGVQRSSLRQCSTQAKEKIVSPTSTESSFAATEAGNKVGEKITGKESAAVRTGQQRKDWRSTEEVVYKKGIPIKGNLFKLPLSEQLLNCLIFSVAGMGAVYLVKPQIRYLCEHGFLGLTPNAGWINGPWLYRGIYLLIMFPSYSAILWFVALCFSRRVWFSFMILKMWSRFLTKKSSQRLARFLDIAHL